MLANDRYNQITKENAVIEFQQERGDYKNEMQLGDVLSDFLEEVERANYLGNGRANNKKNRKRKGI